MSYVPSHIYEKVRKERDNLKTTLETVKERLNGLPVEIINDKALWIIDSDSYNDLVGSLNELIEDALEEG